MDYINVCEDSFHNEVFRNDNYRLYEVKMKPFEETQMHQHLNHTLYICIEDTKFIEELYDGNSGLIDVPAGSIIPRAYEINKTIHKGNNQEKELFIIGIELLKRYKLSEKYVDLDAFISNDYYNVLKLNGEVNLTIENPSILIFLDNKDIMINNLNFYKLKGEYLNINLDDHIELFSENNVLLIEIK